MRRTEPPCSPPGKGGAGDKRQPDRPETAGGQPASGPADDRPSGSGRPARWQPDPAADGRLTDARSSPMFPPRVSNMENRPAQRTALDNLR